jgi:hypothetical protein
MPGAAELSILLNPPGLDAQVGAEFLSRCFATRWTEDMHRWYLQRSFSGEAPDRLILVDGGRAVAVCGVVYRQLRTPDGRLHRVGIATAGATLPGERGRGCFGRVLQAVAQRSASRGCAALIGFLTAGNTSRQAFVRLGAAAIPSAYIVSRDRLPASQTATLQLRHAKVTDDWPLRAAARLRPPAAAGAFYYPDAPSWRSQMVDRPDEVQSLRIGATCRALIESVADTDRLQWLDGDGRERLSAIRTVALRARRRGRRFFMYSTCPQEVAAARRLGLAVRPGYMVVVPLQPRHASEVRDWARMPWHVDSGDRM